jgi:hypothetical protein
MLYCVNEKEGFESFFKLLDEFLARDKNVNTAVHPINSIALANIDKISKLPQEDAV